MSSPAPILHRLRARLADQRGFTMIMAMGVLLVTSLLIGATFVALEGEAHSTQSDLDGKRAYYAAQAGLNAYLYHINQDSTYWQTCANNTTGGWVAVPGNTSGEYYQYTASPANGYSACSNTNVVNSMIDTNTGGLTLTFWVSPVAARTQLSRAASWPHSSGRARSSTCGIRSMKPSITAWGVRTPAAISGIAKAGHRRARSIGSPAIMSMGPCTRRIS